MLRRRPSLEAAGLLQLYPQCVQASLRIFQ